MLRLRVAARAKGTEANLDAIANISLVREPAVKRILPRVVKGRGEERGTEDLQG